jgi:putative DNA methylase
MTSFIETQFPVSKLSKESYKERMANYSQTLTGLGKWWGRKPLILVRAAILGLLMPSSDNPQKDREIFLKILTMDEEGLWRRKKASIPLKEIAAHLTQNEKKRWFSEDSIEKEIPKYMSGTSQQQKQELQRLMFSRLTYDEKLQYCNRPEQTEGLSLEAWKEVNAYLGTNASCINELVQELGKRQFGHVPLVGDCFCGGGSVPFEAARIGCDTFASDLNPVATLLTWAALNIIGGGDKVSEKARKVQREIYEEVNKQISEWEIEHNEQCWRAEAYIYCTEIVCPECGWHVPLAPSWVIGKKTKTVAILVPDVKKKHFDIRIESGVSEDAMKSADDSGTVNNSRIVCPNPDCLANTASLPLSSLRSNGMEQRMRLWENNDLVPRVDDVFQERLYCIKWMETTTDEKGKVKIVKHYLAPDQKDLQREERVLALLTKHFEEWQREGIIPNKRIEEGSKTSEPIRTRGWTYWHHLFNPRQLLLHGIFMKNLSLCSNEVEYVSGLLGLGKALDNNSKLSVWNSSPGSESVVNTFLNQALNPITNYGVRTWYTTRNSWFLKLDEKISALPNEKNTIEPNDARVVFENCDVWITDPPYADAINYHELSEFFLVWYEKRLLQIFHNWYTDSKRAMAIRGSEEAFRQGMVETYCNITDHMLNDGVQIVMFTHQDPSVWADLALILWASGLRVTAAWCISTETDSSLKIGNYVQGTVLLILRKQTSNDTAFLDEIYPQVEFEVKEQLDSMLALEDKEDPNFGDTDYQLAAYAAALRVLTKYKMIEDIDVQRELSRVRQKNEKNPLEAVIENAVKIACDYLVPTGIQTHTWKQFTPEERFYLKGLEIESHGEYRNGAYQELARGFGIREYKNMQASEKANQTRLKTATEFKNKNIGEKEGFGSSLLRNLLFAINETVKNEETSAGKIWLRTELGQQYWNKRREIIELLRYLSGIGMNTSMAHWKKDADAARLLAGAVENDHI